MTKTDVLIMSGVALLVLSSMVSIYYGSAYNSGAVTVKPVMSPKATTKNKKSKPEETKKQFEVVKPAADEKKPAEPLPASEQKETPPVENPAF